MNRSILILLCDFLLLSLLQFVDFESKEEQGTGKALGGGEVFLARAEHDLIDLMQQSMEVESVEKQELREERLALQQSLEKSGQQLEQIGDELAKEKEQAALLAKQKQELEAERARLEQERKRLEEISAQRATELAEREKDVTQLRERMVQTEAWSKTSQKQLELLQKEFRQKQEMLDRLIADKTLLEAERNKLMQERSSLEVRWQVAETEKKAIEQNLQKSEQYLQQVQEEKQQVQQTAAVLAEGVQVLGETSKGIKEEIQGLNTLTAAAIFNRFQNAQVTLDWTTERGGLFGSTREHTVPSLLVSDGERVLALLHLHRTPLDTLRYSNPPRSLYGKIRIEGDESAITRIEQWDKDPRILMIPVPDSLAQKYKERWVSLAKDPLRHDSLVLVGRDGKYYGEGNLQLRPDAKGYLRLPTGLFSRMFGDFSPSRGDWVFNRHGELIGVMVNNEHAVIFDQLKATGTPWTWGESFSPADTEKRLRDTGARIQALPFTLQ
jgi:hypothetical protein